MAQAAKAAHYLSARHARHLPRLVQGSVQGVKCCSAAPRANRQSHNRTRRMEAWGGLCMLCVGLLHTASTRGSPLLAKVSPNGGAAVTA
jgi:hypothetical protein